MSGSDRAPEIPGCPVCVESRRAIVLECQDLPVLGCALWPTGEAARGCARGDISLVFCPSCGHVENRLFDPDEMDYTASYENALHFSRIFREYAEDQVSHLVDDLGIRGKGIVEIGCGDGYFLSLLCERGDNRGVGYDPAYTPDPDGPPLHPDVEIVPAYYDAREATDLVLLRHVLEHIPDPLGFLRAIPRGSVICCEVPDGDRLLRDLAVWDLTYEHCCVFTEGSLRGLFRRAGYRVTGLRRGFGGQTLTLVAVPGENGTDEEVASPGNLSGRAGDRIRSWTQRIGRWAKESRRVALWGVGARGVTFLNLTGRGSGVDVVVDINPRKQGSFVPGTGQEIHPPGRLRDFRPEVVLVPNPVYEAEIRTAMDDLGIDADLQIP